MRTYCLSFFFLGSQIEGLPFHKSVKQRILRRTSVCPCVSREESDCGCGGFRQLHDPSGSLSPLVPDIRVTDQTLLTVYKGHDSSNREGLADYGDLIQDFRQGWKLWPSNKIPYVIDDSVGNCERSTLTVALSVISQNSCLKFQKISYSVYISGGGSNPALHITDQGIGCFASLGFQSPGENIVNIGSGCVNVGTVIHLVMHALGMFHEHQRPDRDNYIQTVTFNICPVRMGGNLGTRKFDVVFSKANEGMNAWTNATERKPYDFASIMHNGPCQYSVSEEYGGGPGGCGLEPSRKAAPLKGKTFLGQPGDIGNRATLSAGDVWMLNQLYPCGAGETFSIKVPEDRDIIVEELESAIPVVHEELGVENTTIPGDKSIEQTVVYNDNSWPAEPEPISFVQRRDEFILPEAPDVRDAITPETTLCTANDAASFSWSKKAQNAGGTRNISIATKTGDSITTPAPTVNPNEELLFKNYFREATSKRMMFIAIGGVVLLVVLSAIVGFFIYKRRQWGRSGVKAAVEQTPASGSGAVGRDDQVPLLNALNVTKETGDTTDSEVYNEIINDANFAPEMENP